MAKTQERSALQHFFEFQFMYDDRPVYKHVQGKEIYLYWSSHNNGEWMVGFYIYINFIYKGGGGFFKIFRRALVSSYTLLLTDWIWIIE